MKGSSEPQFVSNCVARLAKSETNDDISLHEIRNSASPATKFFSRILQKPRENVGPGRERSLFSEKCLKWISCQLYGF